MRKEIFKKIYHHMENMEGNLQEQLDSIKTELEIIINETESFTLFNERTNKSYTYEPGEKRQRAKVKGLGLIGKIKEVREIEEKGKTLKEFMEEKSRKAKELQDSRQLFYNFRSLMSESGFVKPPENILDYIFSLSIISGEIPLSLGELTYIFTYAIRYKAAYYKRNKSAFIKKKEEGNSDEIELCMKIMSYFDEEGNIVANEDIETLITVLDAMYNKPSTKRLVQDFAEEYHFPSKFAAFKEIILKELERQNAKKAEKRRSTYIPSTNFRKNKEENKLWRELQTYYKDGEIIKVCDLEYFKNLLLSLPFSNDQIDSIYNKMKKYNSNQEEQEERYPFTKTQKDLLKKAREQIEKDNIRYFLEEIETSIALIEEDEGTRSYAEGIINENLTYLCYALHVNPEEIVLKK